MFLYLRKKREEKSRNVPYHTVHIFQFFKNSLLTQLPSVLSKGDQILGMAFYWHLYTNIFKPTRKELRTTT